MKIWDSVYLCFDISGRNYTLIYRVGTIVNQYLAVWSNSAVQFLINSDVLSIIWPFGFVFIRPSGFGRMNKYQFLEDAAKHFLRQGPTTETG